MGGKLWPILAAALVLSVVVLGIVLGTRSSGVSVPARPPAVQPVGRGANAQQQARNLGAWLRRYSR